jgi:hypothetical protein
VSQRGSRMGEGQIVRAGDVRRRFVVGMLVFTVGLLNASGVVFASVPLTPPEPAPTAPRTTAAPAPPAHCRADDCRAHCCADAAPCTASTPTRNAAHKPGRDDRDQFQQHLTNIITTSMGAAAATNVRPQLHHVDGGDVCRVQVDPCGCPVEATVAHDRNGQLVKHAQVFVRVSNATKALDEDEKQKYLSQRWPGAA